MKKFLIYLIAFLSLSIYVFSQNEVKFLSFDGSKFKIYIDGKPLKNNFDTSASAINLPMGFYSLKIETEKGLNWENGVYLKSGENYWVFEKDGNLQLVRIKPVRSYTYQDDDFIEAINELGRQLDELVYSLVGEDCIVINDNDFYAEYGMLKNIKNESQRFSEAVNFITNNCFNSKQVKNLVLLFEEENYKMSLLEIAYSKTLDKENYETAISILKKENQEKIKANLGLN